MSKRVMFVEFGDARRRGVDVSRLAGVDDAVEVVVIGRAPLGCNQLKWSERFLSAVNKVIKEMDAKETG